MSNSLMRYAALDLALKLYVMCGLQNSHLFFKWPLVDIDFDFSK